MSSQTIRLRLVIRRHSVPEVKLVWPCIANEDLTVSKLLALVNEVVPLESRDWGLEDYVVELADGKGDSFELLHFQPVGKVLKEDDQVLIRSLSTGDLKRRRLSGRHQISLDGKHLIDGLAFGRPWLRAPRDRPALDLPPRKRARITYEEELEEEEEDPSEEDSSEEDYTEEDSGDEEDPSKQLLLKNTPSTENREKPGSVRLRVRFIDTDQLGEEDDDEVNGDTGSRPVEDGQAEPESDDEDSETSDEDEDEPDVDLADELRTLQADNALIEHAPPEKEWTSLLENNRQDAQAHLSAPVIDISMLDKITALRAAFPFTSLSNVQDALQKNDNDLKKTYQVLSKTNNPIVSCDEVLGLAILGFTFNSSEPNSKQPSEHHNSDNEDEEEVETQTLRLPGQSEATNAKRPLIQEVNDEEPPSAAPREAKMRSDMNTISGGLDEVDDTSSSSDTSDSDSDSESDEDSYKGPEQDSDSDSDSSESEDELMDDADNSTKQSLGPAPRDASSSDSSDSDSDSDSSSEWSNDAGGAKVSTARNSDGSSDSGSSSDSDSSSSESDSESEPEELSSKKQPQVKQSQIPAAKTESQAPNSTPGRTEDTKPPGAGLTRTKRRNARRRDLKRVRAMQALEDTQSPPSTNEAPSEDAEFLARKRALLSVVSDESEDVPSPPKVTSATAPPPMIVEVETEEVSAPTTTQDAAPAEEPAPQRRHKVDMGAGRRMLFGALGLKNPKSKADEVKLRNSLMKDVKPLQNPRVQVVEPKANEAEPPAEQEDEDPEAWRKKISYRAVECCQEDVTLSEPPFPFVQRWDPQQQYTSVRKRKRASQDFNDEKYYGEDYHGGDYQWNGDEEWQDDSQKKKKKSKKRKGKGGYDEAYDGMEITEDFYAETGGNGDEDVVLNYDDIPTSKPRHQDTQFAEMDDLPSLPSDLTTLPSLVLSEVKPGMVITWKQLLMSKATKWQPEMVSTTGLILSISEDNHLHVLLAKRDRDEDDKEYDEHTGQRVYAKFEVPDFDEDEDSDEDNGRRDITWEEMSDPRLVQQAPPTDSSETIAKGTELPTESTKPVQDATANTKVSVRTYPDETMAEELDTQKVRADIAADLKEQEATNKPSGTDIPSGQQPPRLEFTGENSQISSFIPPPMETPSDVTNSPTRQLQETMQSVAGENLPLHDLEERSNVEGKKGVNSDDMNGADDAKDLDEPMPTVEDGWDVTVPDSIPTPELPALPAKDDVPMDHRLRVPSSVGSVRSGRQPPSISGLEDLPEERVEDSIMDNDKRAPSPQLSIVSVRSSSPFPSLEELFQTVRQTQSPAKFSQPSVPRYVKTEQHDVEYEEAMRKLDEGEDENDRPNLRNKSLRSLLSRAPQEKSALQHPIKTEASQTNAVKLEQEASSLSQGLKKELQRIEFPPLKQKGDQAIELSSSPPSVQYTEHYAQDSEDDTYHESPLPQGESWVQKNYSEVTTRSRGKILPATAALAVDKTTTATQSRTARGRTCLPPVRDVTASAFSQIRGRRKPTRKF